MTPQVYEIWRTQWQKERPGRIPPTLEQANSIMELLEISLEDIGMVDAVAETVKPLCRRD